MYLDRYTHDCLCWALAIVRPKSAAAEVHRLSYILISIAMHLYMVCH